MPITPYARHDGTTTYQVRVYLDGRYRYVGTYPTRKTAKVAEGDALKKGRAAKRGMTVTGFRDVWLANTHRKASTLSGYKTSIGIAEDFIGDVPLDRIGEAHMDRLVAEMLTADYSARTVRRTVREFKAMLKAAQRLGYVHSVPSPGSLPKVDAEPVRPLSRDEVTRVIAAAPDYWRPLFLLAATPGLRRGELLGLTSDDVDLEAKTVTVRRAVNGTTGHLEVPKTPAARRTVHIPKQTVRALLAHAPAPTELGLLFPTERGHMAHPSNFSARIVAKAFADAKVDGALHGLRHTYASVLIAAGCSVKVVQTMLGHEDVTTTLNVYGHLFPDEWDKAAKAIDKWLPSTIKLNKRVSNSKKSAGQPS